MQFSEILVIALALSLDAFSVSFAASTSGRVTDRRAAFRLWFHFGLFQFFMPVIGWVLGTAIEPIISAFDHWIAFTLLAIVGVRMIRSGFTSSTESVASDPSHGLMLVMLAVATSIDALAVGLGMAALRMPIWYPSIIIGSVTAAMCMLAIVGGKRVGAWLGNRAQIAAGSILLLIALRVVITHTT